MIERLTATPNPGLRAAIVQRTPLVYAEGAHPVLDRPAHVRAASGLCFLNGKLAIIQDDAAFLAMVDPSDLRVGSVPLPADAAGLRLFDKSRGNKKHKRDLEACFSVELHGVPQLFALGSGSKPAREFVLRVRAYPSGYQVDQIEARSFYAALRDNLDFAGSELNLEGAALRDDRLVLLQRGNGAPARGLVPKNASAELCFADFLAYLDDTQGEPPRLTRCIEHDLGSVQGVPYTFTDATPGPDGSLLFVASAEASPNTVDDGVVFGSVLGIMQRDGTCELMALVDEHGAACREKVEGILLDPNAPNQGWLVVDPDDHDKPGSLLRVKLEGSSS